MQRPDKAVTRHGELLRVLCFQHFSVCGSKGGSLTHCVSYQNITIVLTSRFCHIKINTIPSYKVQTFSNPLYRQKSWCSKTLSWKCNCIKWTQVTCRCSKRRTSLGKQANKSLTIAKYYGTCLKIQPQCSTQWSSEHLLQDTSAYILNTEHKDCCLPT